MTDQYNAFLAGFSQLVGEVACPVNQYDRLARSRPSGDDEVTACSGLHDLALAWMQKDAPTGVRQSYGLLERVVRRDDPDVRRSACWQLGLGSGDSVQNKFLPFGGE